MIRALVLTAGIASALIVDVPTAAAYDPCVRATRDYQRALAAYENAQSCFGGSGGQPRVCDVPQAEARRLNDARQRMRIACRN